MKLFLISNFQVSTLCLIATSALAQDSVATAINDMVAFIPCQAFTSAKQINGSVTLIRWLHSSFHKPLYTLDLRTMNITLSSDASFLHKGRHFPSPETDGRLYLDLSINPIGIHIDPVMQGDDGIYTCVIDFRSRRSIQSTVRLHVIIPPKEAVIRDYNSGLKLEGVIGPYYLKESLKLVCESLEGSPKPTATWQIGYDGLQRATVNGSLLVINSLERHDQWSHYTCTTQNNNMTAPKSVTVIIEIFLPPLELLLQIDIHQPFISGENVQISCLSFGSYPKAHIQWKKNGEVITAEERVSDNGNVTTSFLKFVAQPSDDKSEIECFTVNPDLPTITLKEQFLLQVYYKPEVRINILSNQSGIIESQPLILQCKVKANPEPFKILWCFNGKKITNDSSIVILYNKLYIKNLIRSHSGTFSCHTSNHYGKEKASVAVAVKHKPVCCKPEISYSNGPAIDDANVTCNLASYPSDVTFYWTLRNSSSNHSWSTGQVSHTHVELQESNTELLCWGKNEIGLQLHPCNVVLAKASGKSFLFLPVLLISICVLIILIVSVVIVVRRYKSNYDVSDVPSNNLEMVQLKDMEVSNLVIEFILYLSLYVTICYFYVMKTHYYDNHCGKLISKCVKQAHDSPESDCSSKLLMPNSEFSVPTSSDLQRID